MSTAPAGLLLTHGAGGDRTHHGLVALEEGLDLPVERIDMPYRREGRRAPDRPEKILPFLGTEAASFAERLGVDEGALLLGGRSFGGRMFSMAVAEGLPAAGLVLLSYPLHPAGRPERLRVEHFGELDLPCLFVSGERDPFATPDELTEHTAALPGDVTVRFVTGAHDPKPAVDAEIVAIVGDWIATAF